MRRLSTQPNHKLRYGSISGNKQKEKLSTVPWHSHSTRNEGTLETEKGKNQTQNQGY